MVVKVIFDIADTLYGVMFIKASGDVFYRFDAYNGIGECRSTEPKELELVKNEPLAFPLENWLTRDGGNIRVHLVITEIKNGETEMELFSFPALISLKNVPAARQIDGESSESISTYAKAAKDAAESAEQIAQELRSDADAGKFNGFSPIVTEKVNTAEEYILEITDKDGTYESPNIRGARGAQGERGASGVYVGSGDMPEDCNIQIDPNGDSLTPDEIYQTLKEEITAETEAVNEALDRIISIQQSYIGGESV